MVEVKAVDHSAAVQARGTERRESTKACPEQESLGVEEERVHRAVGVGHQ